MLCSRTYAFDFLLLASTA
jgi:hypothetical protein